VTCAGQQAQSGGGLRPTTPDVKGGGKTGITVLEPGKAIEMRIAGGDVHFYRVDLAAGQFMHVLLDQHGVDVVETLLAPDGREVMKVDYQNGTYGQQSLSFVADLPGAYLLKVKKLMKGAAAGTYQISLKEIHEATIQDRRRVAADKNLIESGRMIEKGDGPLLEEVIQKCAAAHDFFKSSGDSYQDALSLHMGASASARLGKLDIALSLYKQALVAYAAANDHAGQAKMHNGIGAVYFAQGKNDSALEAYNKAMELYQIAGDPADQALLFVDFGLLHFSMGDSKTALEYYERALPLCEKAKFDAGQASAFMNMAEVYRSSGNLYRALKFSEMALYYYNKASDRGGTAAVLDRIGWIYFLSDDKEEALLTYNRSLSLSRRNGDRYMESITLNNIAWLHFLLGEKRVALGELTKALEISMEIGSRRSEAGTLRNLMTVWKSLGNRRAAIFYGKQAVNIYQEVRSQSQSLDKELQKSFLHSSENVYRTLAELLVADGRLNEAQQILDMLKEDEYFEYLRRQSAGAFPQATITATEAATEKSISDTRDRITAIGRDINELQAKGDLTEEEKRRLAQLKAQRDGELKTYRRTIEELQKVPGGVATGGSLAGLLDTESLIGSTLRDLGYGTVALYTIEGEDEYTVILFTQDVQVSRKYKIKAAELNRKIVAFRQVLQDPNQDPLPLAQELYKIIVGPVASNLKAIKAKTLMWSFDGLLRYIPIAALHDGDKYLVEQYQNVVVTQVSYARLKERGTQRDWRALGLGVTKNVGNYPALPGVKEELNGIIRREGDAEAGSGVLPGVILLDDDFTEEKMEQALQGKYQVVHIASHFDFEPGGNRKSSLLLGDGKYLLISDVAGSVNIFDRVELLTLSACSTALGGPDASGADLENFALLAQRKGAKAVTATLWSVADSSTSLLMRRFYQSLENNQWMPKTEALRQAQLSLLYGESDTNLPANTTRAEIMMNKDASSQAGAFKPKAGAPYSHPYFWAPFIIIGNWQ
jgi:CHAT domain-containing protein/predicted negative regulator of RcsB-dependent stress response